MPSAGDEHDLAPGLGQPPADGAADRPRPDDDVAHGQSLAHPPVASARRSRHPCGAVNSTSLTTVFQFRVVAVTPLVIRGRDSASASLERPRPSGAYR